MTTPDLRIPDFLWRGPPRRPEELVCFHCGGSGRDADLIGHGAGSYWSERACDFCEGTGIENWYEITQYDALNDN